MRHWEKIEKVKYKWEKTVEIRGKREKIFRVVIVIFYASLQRKEIRFNTISRYCD